MEEVLKEFYSLFAKMAMKAKEKGLTTYIHKTSGMVTLTVTEDSLDIDERKIPR